MIPRIWLEGMAFAGAGMVFMEIFAGALGRCNPGSAVIILLSVVLIASYVGGRILFDKLRRRRLGG